MRDDNMRDDNRGGLGVADKKYILAIDQGTTSSRAILFDRKAQIYALAQQEFPQYFPEPGWVEHDAEEIWQSVLAVINQLLADHPGIEREIAGIGITNQRETTVIWDRETGEPIYNAIVWQSRQTSEICEDAITCGHDRLVRESTGLLIDSYFSATKIQWLLDRVPGARERADRGELMFGTIDTWLLYKLTAGAVHLTDYTNASRTLLFNIKTCEWDDELLEIFQVPRALLPEVRSCSEVYAYTAPAVFNGYEIPVSGIAGDQQAALFGQACFSEGMAKNTYGTGSFMLMNIGDQPILSDHNLLTTIAWGIDGQITYALEGSVFVTGAAIKWLQEELGVITSSADSERVATSVESSDGLYIVPAFTGLGAPYWEMDALGAVYGMTRGTNAAHLTRATLESIAYQIKDILNSMEADSGVKLNRLRVDGGAVRNNFLMQFQADMLGVPVERTTIHESTALGAAFLAGLAVGFWQDRDLITQTIETDRLFEPQMADPERDELYLGWKRAVSATLYWATLKQ